MKNILKFTLLTLFSFQLLNAAVTDIVIPQRDTTTTFEDITITGSTNTNEFLGFDGSGVLVSKLIVVNDISDLSVNLADLDALADPGADRIPFWDDSASHIVWLTIGSGLSITGTTLDSTGTTRATSVWDGSATLTRNTDYTYAISAAKTIKLPTSTVANGEFNTMRFVVTGGPHIITFQNQDASSATVYRSGTNGAVTTLTLRDGYPVVKFFYDTQWNVIDNVADAEAAYTVYGNFTAGSAVPGFSSAVNLGGATSLEIPNAAGTATLANGGEISVNTTDKQIGVHNGTKEVAIPLIHHQTWSFDPKAVCDGSVDRLFLMSTGVSEPKGITVVGWKVSFEADPTTEVDLDLKRADAYIGVANSAVMDVLDTTAGASSEATYTNINGGSVVANGKVLYLEFGTAYSETTHQVIFEMWWETEED